MRVSLLPVAICLCSSCAGPPSIGTPGEPIPATPEPEPIFMPWGGDEREPEQAPRSSAPPSVQTEPDVAVVPSVTALFDGATLSLRVDPRGISAPMFLTGSVLCDGEEA
ncbi:MAG: hypothetical protein AAFX99_24380, partial [Myxococcota bacterium]